MAVKRPTLDQLQEVAYSLGIHLSEEQLSITTPCCKVTSMLTTSSTPCLTMCLK
jgi:hypothetical protein